MPAPELSTIIILSEIVIIETVIIISFLVYLYMKSKNKSKKLNSLLKSFIDNEENRLKYLFSTFNKPEYINKEKYNSSIRKIIFEENEFYKLIASTIYKNDLKLFDSLSVEIQKITYPCAELTTNNEKVDGNENLDKIINTKSEINDANEGDALDDLLSDNTETEDNIENNPEFDLSESIDSEIEIESTPEKEEIAEIPSDLLNNITSEQEQLTEIDINENNNSDSSINATKIKTEE